MVVELKNDLRLVFVRLNLDLVSLFAVFAAALFVASRLTDTKANASYQGSLIACYCEREKSNAHVS